MDISRPIFVIGIKDEVKDKVTAKKALAVEIILEILLGKSSKLYKDLYESQELIAKPELEYEFSNNYAHILISGQAQNPKKILEELTNKINELKEKGINEEEYTRIKKKIYGQYVMEYNDVDSIAGIFLSDYFKGIKPFEYIEEFASLTIEYVNQIFKEVFNTNKMVISVVK